MNILYNQGDSFFNAAPDSSLPNIAYQLQDLCGSHYRAINCTRLQLLVDLLEKDYHGLHD